jgi:hypothetical protein
MACAIAHTAVCRRLLPEDSLQSQSHKFKFWIQQNGADTSFFREFSNVPSVLVTYRYTITYRANRQTDRPGQQAYSHNLILLLLLLLLLLFLVGWEWVSWYCVHCWPIVPAPDDRWWWLWRNWWNKDWQGKPKYSEKTCPSATLSTTNPTSLD